MYGGAEWAAVRAVWNAGKVLRSGITTFCDSGSTWNVAVTCRDAIANGMFFWLTRPCALAFEDSTTAQATDPKILKIDDMRHLSPR